MKLITNPDEFFEELKQRDVRIKIQFNSNDTVGSVAFRNPKIVKTIMLSSVPKDLISQ